MCVLGREYVWVCVCLSCVLGRVCVFWERGMCGYVYACLCVRVCVCVFWKGGMCVHSNTCVLMSARGVMCVLEKLRACECERKCLCA